MALGTPVASTPVYSGVGNLLSNVYPSGIAAADAVVLFVAQKPSVANGGSVTTPAGYTLQGSKLAAGGYGTTTTDDVGNTNLWVFTKDVVDGTEGGTTLYVTTAGNSASWAVLVHVPTNAGPMTYAVATGEQPTAPTSPLTELMDSDPGFSARDMAIWAMSIPTDTDTPNLFSNHGITAPGVTFGAAAELREPDTTINRDQAGMVAYAPVSSGTSSGAPTVTADLAGTLTNVRGPLVMIRLRESSTDGALNSTLGAATSSSAGGVQVTGDAGNTLGAVTASAAGTVRVTGSASNTLGGLTASSAGGVSVTGATSQTLSAATVSATGTSLSGLSGGLNSTLGSLTSSASGTVRASAAMSATLAALTSSAAGAVRVSGAASATLTGVTLLSVGAARASGTLATTLSAMTSAAAGGVRVSGSASNSLGTLTLTATGGALSGISGSLSATLVGLSLSTSGGPRASGTLSATLAPLSGVAVAQARVSGALANTLAAATVTAVGVVRVTGTRAGTLADSTVSSAGTVSLSGSLSGELAGIQLFATGSPVSLGELSAVLDDLDATGAAAVRVHGVAGISLDSLTLAAVGTFDVALVRVLTARTFMLKRGAGDNTTFKLTPSAY